MNGYAVITARHRDGTVDVKLPNGTFVRVPYAQLGKLGVYVLAGQRAG